MKFRRYIFARLYRDPEPGVDGSLDTSVDPGTQASAADPGAGADTQQQAAQQTPEDRTAAAMAAMFPDKAAGGETEAAKEQRLRDEAGRFSKKPEVDPKTAAIAADPNKKPVVDPKDATAMPEGLTPKAQERFQALANTNKELTGRLEQVTALAGGNPDAVLPMLQSAAAMRDTFQEHGVKREQFEQGMQVIGMMNRGDLAGAQQFLEEQLRMISLVTGKPPGQIDALSAFPDLRDSVDNLQMTEAHALEVARARTHQQHLQQSNQREQQIQQSHQQEQQAIHGGQLAVDRFCKARMTSDLDYAKIEPMLLKEIQGGLLEGVPPQRWAAIVEKTYNLIKQTAGTTRGQATGGGVLRPSGGDVAQHAPKTAFEAMWGKAQPT